MGCLYNRFGLTLSRSSVALETTTTIFVGGTFTTVFREVWLQPGVVDVDTEVPTGTITIGLSSSRATRDVGVDTHKSHTIVQFKKCGSTGITRTDALSRVTSLKTVGLHTAKSDLSAVFVARFTSLGLGLDQAIPDEEDLLPNPRVIHRSCVDGHRSRTLDILRKDDYSDIVDKTSRGSAVLWVSDLLRDIVVRLLDGVTARYVNPKLNLGGVATSNAVRCSDHKAGSNQCSGTIGTLGRLRDQTTNSRVTIVLFPSHNSLFHCPYRRSRSRGRTGLLTSDTKTANNKHKKEKE